MDNISMISLDSAKKKRERCPNWLEDEKTLLKFLMKSYTNILENKNTDTRTNVMKKEAWDELCKQFNNSEGRRPYRTASQLKTQWSHMKVNRRKLLGLVPVKSSIQNSNENTSEVIDGQDEDSWSWLPDNYTPIPNVGTKQIMDQVDIIMEPYENGDEFEVLDDGSQTSNEQEPEELNDDKEIDNKDTDEENAENNAETIEKTAKCRNHYIRKRSMVNFDRKLRLQLHQLQVRNELLKEKVLLQQLNYWKKMEAALDRENAALPDY